MSCKTSFCFPGLPGAQSRGQGHDGVSACLCVPMRSQQEWSPRVRAQLPSHRLNTRFLSSQVPVLFKELLSLWSLLPSPSQEAACHPVGQPSCLTQALSSEGSDTGKKTFTPALVPGLTDATPPPRCLGHPPCFYPFSSLLLELSGPSSKFLMC